MKVKIIFLFCFLFLLFNLNISSQVLVDFDTNFKNALLFEKCVDIDGDGLKNELIDVNQNKQIDQDEALSVKSISLPLGKYKSVRGISNFKNLKEIDNVLDIDSLDLRGLDNLVNLFSQTNTKLRYINISNLTKLERFNLAYTYTDVDLRYSNNNSLTYMFLSDVYFDSLNLSSFKRLKDLTLINNNLEIIQIDDNLDSLIEIYCSSNKYIESLDFTNTPNIENISISYSSIYKLDLVNNLKLKGLDLYKNDKLGTLFLKNNSKLKKFSAYEKNLKLICSDTSEIGIILNEINAQKISNCYVTSNCTLNQGEKFYKVFGNVYLDMQGGNCNNIDLNCVKTNFTITSEKSSLSMFLFNTCDFLIPLTKGKYSIKPKLEFLNHFSMNPDSLTFSFPSLTDSISTNFCISPKGEYSQIDLHLVPITPARPGFEANYNLVFKNKGNTKESGTIKFIYNSSLTTFLKSNQIPSLKEDGSITFNFSNLLPFESRSIRISLKINKPSDVNPVNINDTLLFNLSTLNNTIDSKQLVVGSFDPNEKICQQGEVLKLDHVGQFLDYIIHFENLGNYFAQNIIIKDVIDTTKFDLSSIEFVDASHDFYSRINKNVVELVFEDINLPYLDSINDGYISFRIKSRSDIPVGSVLENLADIYFDYNFPIRTNTAKTIITKQSITKELKLLFNVFPNPTQSKIKIECDIEDRIIYELRNSFGVLVDYGILDQSNFIDVSNHSDGIYFLGLKNKFKKSDYKIIVIK